MAPAMPDGESYCSGCGAPMMSGFVVIRRDYFSRKTGRKMEMRAEGLVCPALHAKYRYDIGTTHDGYETVSIGKRVEVEV